MKISINANRCEPSPMRKFHPLAVKAKEDGKKIYHLNIGQPDIPTPAAFYEATRAFDNKTLAYEASPGNPTGVVLSREEMRMIADVAKEHDLFLISDEVYREFCYDDKYGIPSMGRFSDIDDNLVIVDSVSKRFSSCGARVGCVITKNKELQQAILKFCQSRLSVATLDQVGATALYSVDKEFFKQSKAEYKKRRDTVVNGLRQIPGVLVEEPMGAFYVMAQLPVDDADKFQRWLLTAFSDNGETVMFAPGAPFYETPGSGINEVRIAYVLEQKELERAIELLGKGIAQYRKEQMGL